MPVAQVKRLFTEPADSLALQVPRALAASVFCSLVDVAVLLVLVERCGWPPVWAATVGYLVGGVFQYAICTAWVFPNNPESLLRGYLTFTALSLGGLVVTWVVIAFMHDFLQLHYGLAKVAALVLSFSWNFTSRKVFVYQSSALSHAK